tara:strand:+ start:45 stop:386 length:342 start_codon:yes stop_codon:yes gene_type:complete
MENIDDIPVTCGRLNFLHLLYVKYKSSETDWETFKRKVEAVNELFTWDLKIAVPRKVYKRIGRIEPIDNLNYTFLKLVREKAFTGELLSDNFKEVFEFQDSKKDGQISSNTIV